MANGNVRAAAEEYRAQQERRTHPAGKFDKAQRWYPEEREKQPCCGYIRRPTRAWPYSLMTHCRSAGHVAALFGVSATDLRKALRR